MIAYSRESLAELEVLDVANEWRDKKIISEEQLDTIKEKHKHNLFIPNIFVRIGLFVLTLILVNAALGLFSMFFIVMDPSETVIAFFSIFYGAVIFVALETVIINKRTFRAGIDDALLYLGVGALVFGVCFLLEDTISSAHNEILFYSLIALPFFTIAAIRYLDNMMTLCAFVCLNLVVFSIALKLGNLGKAITPFIIMGLSALAYFASRKYFRDDNLRIWHLNLKVVQFLALVTFYLAGNYFVVRELTIGMFNLVIEPGKDIPLGFIFHITTVAIPLSYLYFGGKKKDKLIFWSGLLCLVASAMTFKYYYSLGNHGVTLTVSGLALSLLIWYTIKYFLVVKYGISSAKEDDLISSDAEGLVLTYSFPQQTHVAPVDTEFGGGEFGGGGAGGKY